jgi:hypothetical protein
MEETLANLDNTSKPLSNVQQVRVDILASNTLALNTQPKPLNQTNMSRSSTPGPPADAPSTGNTAAEDLLLRQYAAAIIDIRIKEDNVLRLWQQVISVMLPEDHNNDGQAEGLYFMHRINYKLIIPFSCPSGKSFGPDLIHYTTFWQNSLHFDKALL